jgi:FkbM family methyltransferase
LSRRAALQGPLPSFLENARYVLGSIWHEESNRKQRIRRLSLFLGWQFWKRVVKTTIVVKLFNGLRFRAYPDCQASSAVMYTRVPDSRDILFLRAHIGEGTLIDVGANVGLVTLLLADKVQHALLFEPNPIAAQRARENLALNQLNFEVHELALSDTTGTVDFEDEGGVSTCNRTVSGFSTSVATRKVRCIQLDEFLAQQPPRFPITAVKIDVEGHENQVLAGMMKCLRYSRPRLVMFEYLQRTNLRETLRLFASVGYTVLQLTSRGVEIAGPDVPPLQDLFACPNESLQEFTAERRADC